MSSNTELCRVEPPIHLSRTEPSQAKRVSFASDDRLVEVHDEDPEIAEDLQALRLEGVCWIQAGLDRLRFQRRVSEFEAVFDGGQPRKEDYVRSYAARRIQAAWRGYQVRNAIQNCGCLALINRGALQSPSSATSTATLPDSKVEAVSYQDMLEKGLCFDGPPSPPIVTGTSQAVKPKRRRPRRRSKTWSDDAPLDLVDDDGFVDDEDM